MWKKKSGHDTDFFLVKKFLKVLVSLWGSLESDPSNPGYDRVYRVQACSTYRAPVRPGSLFPHPKV